MKISHVKGEAVSSVIEWLKEKYENLPGTEVGSMKISRGKVHEFLGMDMDY